MEDRKIEDYTEDEFLQIVKDIFECKRPMNPRGVLVGEVPRK
ncbi:bacteriocin immunity protein [Enterovibrio norvegicus]